MQRRARLSLAALGGAGAAFGHVPVSLVPLALAGLAALAFAIRRAPDARSGAWTGFAGGCAYFALTLHWIVEPFFVEPEVFGWMAPFALFFCATGFALFWAAAGAFAAWAGGGRGRFALAFGAAFAAVETLRSLILTGFPWAMLGYVWTESAGAQIAAVIGPFGLTLVTTCAAGVIATAWPRRGHAATALATAWLLPLALGALRLEAPADAPGAPVVRLVQPNAPQHEKWDPARVPVFYGRLLALTAEGDERPDLIVWPETSAPFLLEPGQPQIARLAAAAGGAPLAFGVHRFGGGNYFNTLAVMDGTGEVTQVYDKWHLVPFGEYLPFGGLLGQIGLRGLAQFADGGYASGPGPRLIDLGPLGRVLPLICYEAIFPEEVGATARPDWILHATNDAWFGTFAGPQQHLAQARMRAIEQGVPVLRAANTGISAVIDGKGRVRESLPLGQAGRIDAALPPVLSPTPYSRLGDGPFWALIALALALPAAFRLRRSA